MRSAVPESSVADVTSIRTADVAAVAARSTRTPVEVPVSTPVEVMRSIELPAPRTDVPCTRFTSVAEPSVMALFVIERASPAVVLADVTAIRLQSPVVDVPTMRTKSPV